MHSVAVCALMVALARQLGMSEEQCRHAGLAGLLHDLGKAVMPPLVLNKPGKLTDDEFAVMKTHPERGHALLLEGKGAGDAALEVCLHHHGEDGRQRLPAQAGWRADPRPVAHGRGLRRLRRHHLEPPLQGGLGPGRVDRAHGLVEGPTSTLRCSTPSCAASASTPPARWCAWPRGGSASWSSRTPTSSRHRWSSSSSRPSPTCPSLRCGWDLATANTADRIAGREPPDKWGFKHIEDLWVDPDLRRAAK